MADIRRSIRRAELDDAYEGGAFGLYGAALFDNPNLTLADISIKNEALSDEFHTLVCLMCLMTDSSQDGVEALIERFGYLSAFRDGVGRLGWPELDRRLAAFLALMEPYADDKEWWERLDELTDAGAFDAFKRWFWDQELELAGWWSSCARTKPRFLSLPELVMRTERLFSYGTLQQEDVQRATFGRLLEGAADVLVGFEQQMLEITDPDVLAKSGKRFHVIAVRTGDPAHRIGGTVFLVTPAELGAADAYEVDDYERVSVTLASGLDAWVYVKRQA